GGGAQGGGLRARVGDATPDPSPPPVGVTRRPRRKKLGAPPLIETVVGVGYRVPAPGSPLPTAPTSSAPVSAVPISPVPPTPLPPLVSQSSSSRQEPSTEDVPIVASGALTGPTLEAPVVSPDSDAR